MQRTENGATRRRTRISVVSLVTIVAVAVVLIAIAASRIGAGSSPAGSDHFAAFDQAQTEEDTMPENAAGLLESETMSLRAESTRLLSETMDARYFLAESDRESVCLIYVPHDLEPAAGCTSIRLVAEEGVLLGVSSVDDGTHYAIALPDGYDEVSSDEGDTVGSVEDGLFTFTPNEGADLPETLVVTGPEGEFQIELPSIGS